MSISFNPASGSTINFGNVAQGTSANQSVTLNFVSPNNSDPGQYSYTTNTSVITGPQASLFTGNMFDSFFGPGNGSDTKTFKFSPTGLGAASATLTWTYTLVSNGVSIPGTGTYTLSGTGVSGGSPPPPNELPSLVKALRYLLIPGSTQVNQTNKVLSYFDVTTLDDANDSSTYLFKAEDILADRVPTVRRVIITYVDKGVATLTVNVSGINDQGVYTFGQVVLTIGTVGATGNLMTAFADLTVSCFRPQVKLSRAAGGGPIYISTVVVSGMVERQVTL